MKNSIKKLALSTLLLSGLSTTVMANDGDVYVGFQSSGFSSNGISAKLDLTDKYTVQGIVGFFGDVNNYSVRGLYHFKQKDHYNLYGYGSLGMWSWNNAFYDESVLGYGAGAGVEYDLRGLDSEFIPLFVNLELGMDIVNFDHYTYGGVELGLGLHYKF